MTRDTSLSQAKTGDAPTSSNTDSAPDAGVETDNGASTLIEAPVHAGEGKLKKHEFPDGGGSGGAEKFRRGDRPIVPSPP